MRIPYREIIYIYRKAYVIVVWVILRLEIIKLSYIESVMLDHATYYPNQWW